MQNTMARTFAGLLLATSLLAGCSADLKGIIGTGPNPSASPGGSVNLGANVGVSLPNPLDIATLTGLKGTSCSEEGSLKSASSSQTSNVTFKNSSSGKINVYWLDYSGKRVSYKQGLDAGASFQQSTYVTHPWVITNDQDQCMGIYTPTDSGNTTLDVKKTVTVSGSGSATGSGSVAVGSAGEARVRQGIECLKAKGKSAEAMTAQASLNLYLEAQKQGGMATILGNAHLTQATSIVTGGGC